MTSTSRLPIRIASRTRTAGFTLVELIGVLCVVAILITLGATASIGRFRRTARSVESSSMEHMVDAVRDYVVRTRTIPSASDLPSAIANELASPLNRVLNTAPGYARAFLVDPALEIGPSSLAASARKLPFTQTSAGTVEPRNARILIVSSILQPLPDLSSLDAAAFDSLWNTTEKTVPANWTAWGGNAEDLRLQRIDLASLFHRVALGNIDSSNLGIISIDAFTNQLTLAQNAKSEAWYLSSTPLNLHLADGTLMGRELLKEDTSYIFENGQWVRYILYGIRPPLSNFGNILELFRNSPVPPNAANGATPQTVVEEIYTYLRAYSDWATDPTGAFQTGGPDPANYWPSYRRLVDSQARLESFLGNLCR
jgi:Tfp pilus assembly protein PilE